LNPSVSNGPWKKKCKAILEHSALNLNRKLETLGEWNEDAIRQRAIVLFQAAKDIWPYPGRLDESLNQK
jgi:hypothetical protein